MSARCRSSTQRIPRRCPAESGRPTAGGCYSPRPVVRKLPANLPQLNRLGGVSRFMDGTKIGAVARSRVGRLWWERFAAVAVGSWSFALRSGRRSLPPARRKGRGCPSASEGACVKSTLLAVVGRCPPVRVSVRCREHKSLPPPCYAAVTQTCRPEPPTAWDAVRSPPAGGTG